MGQLSLANKDIFPINSSRHFNHIELVLLAAILVVAATLRMGWPGMTEFKADEARLLTLALDMAEGQGIALRGIGSSVGFPNFPMSVWVYALPLLLWRHVYAATLFTGLLNTGAVAAGYWLVRRYWGVVAALSATLLFAVSPWAVIFSRKIWAQNLLPLFVMGWVIGAVLAFVERRPKFLLLHFLCLAVAVQIHLAAVALLPVTAVYLLIFRRRVNWRWLWGGVGLGGLTAVPFAIYLAQNLRLLSKGGELVGGGGSISLESWQFTGMLSLGTDIHSLAGAEAFADFLSRIPNMTAIYWLWSVLMLGGMGIVLYGLWSYRSNMPDNYPSAQPSQAEAGLIVLLWLFGPPLFFTWHNTPVFLHYFISVLPVPYILAGIALAQLIVYAGRYKSTAGRLAVSGGLLATAVAQTWAITALLLFLSQTNTPGGFGTPLARQLAAVNAAKQVQTETGAAEILVVGSGENVTVDADAAVYDVLLRPVPHRFVDVTRSVVFPVQPAVVLLDNRTSAEWVDGYNETAVHAQTMPLRDGEGSIQVLTLAVTSPQPEINLEPDYLLANWVNLFGYDQPVLQADGTAVWHLYWHPGDNPDPMNYQFFVHLLNDEGERLGQVDMPAFSPQQWRSGDVIISRFALPWPESEPLSLTLRVGMYSYPELVTVPLLDAAGNPYAEAAEIRIMTEPLQK